MNLSNLKIGMTIQFYCGNALRVPMVVTSIIDANIGIINCQAADEINGVSYASNVQYEAAGRTSGTWNFIS